jgi:hypothetical protein
MATTTNNVELKQLEEELQAAGVNTGSGIGSSVDGSTTTVFGYSADGKPVDLGSTAQTVLDNHVAVPVTDPRIAVIDSMESLTDADKEILISLIVG